MGEEKKKKFKGASGELVPAQDTLQEEESSIDLYDLLLKFLDSWRWIALAAIIGAVAMLVYTVWFVTPLYKATSKLYVTNSKDSVINLSDLQISNYLANDYKEVYTNWELHEEVLKVLETRKANGEEGYRDLRIDKYTYSGLSRMISISNPSNTRILYITITSPDKNEATLLANTYAEVSMEFIAMRMDTTSPKQFEHARTPSSPSSPNITRNALLGFIAGALIAMAIITLRFIVDDYIRTADDIEKYLHLPTLGTIMLQKHSDDSGSESTKHRRKGDEDDGDDDE